MTDAAGPAGARPLDDILDRARWAPSGDNRQTCRFEILADDHVVVHGFDTRHDCVYDLDGSSSQIAVGALLETMKIAASRHRLRTVATRQPDSPPEAPRIDVRLVADRSVEPDPLEACIETRTVQRRPLKTRPLTDDERRALEASVGEDHRIVWREGREERRRMAAMLWRSARIRLTMPEAYLVHRDAIEWGARFSADRVPEAAVGLDPMTARLMRWVMRSWGRVAFFNRFLAGTWVPRMQLDALPAVLCAAHFAIVSKHGTESIDDFVAGGRAVQRFWLTATRLGLQLQPEVTPLVFARYFRHRRTFSALPRTMGDAGRIAALVERELGKAEAEAAVFMGRIGAGRPARARSLRLPLEQLMLAPSTERTGR